MAGLTSLCPIYYVVGAVLPLSVQRNADNLLLEGTAVSNSTPNWAARGAYAPDQAARLLGIRADMVKRWLYGSRTSQAALIPEYADHRGALVTFLDLIQAMAIRDIREQRRVSLQKIRATVGVAQEHGVSFPFARRHRTYVFGDDVVLRLNDGRLIQATGKYHQQDLMEAIVYEYLDDLGFDKTGLADTYTPCRLNFRSVQLSPLLNFGAPTVQPCGYTVKTLITALDAEGGIERAANVCGVSPDDVRLAIQFEQRRAA